jgi:hypothetical protein
MKPLMLVGVLLLALGLAGIIWGLVKMADDRATLDIGDSTIVFNEGEFPPIGIAGAVAAGLGAVLLVVGGVGGRRAK